MFNLKGSLEDQIKSNEKLLKELEVQDESLRREFATLFAEFGLTPEAVAEYTSNRENFSDEEWAELENNRAALEQSLKEGLNQIQDVRSSRKARAGLRVERHWLPCG